MHGVEGKFNLSAIDFLQYFGIQKNAGVIIHSFLTFLNRPVAYPYNVTYNLDIDFIEFIKIVPKLKTLEFKVLKN